jgi:iron complex transport system substrate-binding protein
MQVEAAASTHPHPVRIASLLSSGTEMLYALGLGERVVAVSHECDYPAEVRHKPRVTFTRVAAEASSREIDDHVRSLAAQREPLYGIDVARLAALRPELIVTQAQCDVCAVRYEDVVQAVRETPELRGTQVIALNPATLGDIFADIVRVGRAAGCQDEAGRYVDSLGERVERIRGRTASLTAAGRPRVACIEWIDPLMLAGNWMPELIEIAGGQSGLTRPGHHSPYADWQTLAGYDPQVVLVAPCGFDLERTLAECQSEPFQWRQLAAFRNGRAFAVDGNAYFNRSGPRMVDSLEILAHLIHPEWFGPPPLAGGGMPWRKLM